jgi:MerR family transcriptional regulator, light-induced transcriptional regulator
MREGEAGMPSQGQSDVTSSSQKPNQDNNVAKFSERAAQRGSRAARTENPSPPVCAAHLVGVIEAEIVPRLMLAHRAEGQPARSAPTTPPARRISPEEAVAFASLALSSDIDVLLRQIDACVAEGASAAAVQADLLGGAARQLGAWWEEDRCSFVDVTIALGRLQQLIFETARRYSPPTPPATGKTCLLTTLPGDQHSFGVRVVEESFRSAGWHVGCDPGLDRGALLRAVKGQWWDVFGLSLNRIEQCEPAHALIRAVRRASANPDLFVLVGGRIKNDAPDLAARVGADASASEANEAVERAQRAVSLSVGSG